MGWAPCPGPPPTALSCPQTRKEGAPRRGHSDLTPPPPHGDTLGVSQAKTSHQRLFYVKRSDQTTWQDTGESRLLLPELPSQKPWSSGLWGAPRRKCSMPPKTMLHRGAPDGHRGAGPAGSPRQVCAHPLGPSMTSWEQDRSHHAVSEAHSVQHSPGVHP